ncbi:lytic transglycosylase domain-containing protein [Xylella taiwanensis]|uniref:Lytic transglycosylase domain-containing protein n=1 Tax=Xylella taiwanensis TaxID=1444770 RepID=A0ABS8TWV7_9GAMM|nr:lytic transglycosylase domain-containing protein [Xylella taiwanensis]MCD8456207.1 lytic transglycosylase domain-containing protein [Xylella taiwanensis]MCD8458616.1 lytic transglycosylase domain-containing protein [Xylella taiwanensis]MCD8460750.1 lytic transglycosylase domain-containing protein [Xylella taiwanensis]MCD8463191.1 lytic transglycosylase domain-containing protein [Xylella taiwanensis]MCD8465255.1 lytic transglycosylase domain-containing protein [Xylella taiwanensis]
MTLLLRFVTVLALGITGCARAQNGDPQLLAVRNAIAAAENGRLDPSQAATLSGHPLYGWIEYANLRRNIDTISNTQAQNFLSRYADQAVAQAFRSAWLPVVVRRKDWATLLANWKPTRTISLRCAQLEARQRLGKADAQWTKEVQALWRDAGKPMSDACDSVFAALSAQGDLDNTLRWARIEAAADAQQPEVMRAAARGLPATDQALANDYASFVETPHRPALNWPKTERSQRIVIDGLARLARSDPSAVERSLPTYVDALDLNETQRGQVLYQIALWTVASYLPDAARRLAAVPESAYDERLHEWRTREALARGDWPAALEAIRKMPPTQRGDPRWQYFEARLAEKTGESVQAQTLYRAAARSATFHGFLAADHLQQPYTLCPWHPNDAADRTQAKAAVARTPALVRAISLFQIDRTAWATLEWNDALTRFNDNERRLAVEVASAADWFDRAVFALGKQPAELRMYDLRFPVRHDATINREAAKHGLDPAWIAAEIRAESVFNPRARSPANARGLMQVLPSTAASVAKRIGLTDYGNADNLYDADTNIAIGSAYLRQLLDQYNHPYLTIAAYNAGPGSVQRWLAQRPNYDPDLWIETINYKETREYVARVLAFSVIYDWRLNGDALPLTDRLLGKPSHLRKQIICQ